MKSISVFILFICFVSYCYSSKENENKERTLRFEQILETLALEDDLSIKLAIARNPNTPARTLDKLALDDNFEVRKVVAINKNTSAITLEKLSKDESIALRECVAANLLHPHYKYYYIE